MFRLPARATWATAAVALAVGLVVAPVAPAAFAAPASVADPAAAQQWNHRITTPYEGERVSRETILGSLGYRPDYDHVNGRVFYIDGVEVGRSFECSDIDIGCEYQMVWDSRTVPNGQHVITSQVIYDDQLLGKSDPVTFTVAN